MSAIVTVTRDTKFVQVHRDLYMDEAETIAARLRLDDEKRQWDQRLADAVALAIIHVNAHAVPAKGAGMVRMSRTEFGLVNYQNMELGTSFRDLSGGRFRWFSEETRRWEGWSLIGFPRPVSDFSMIEVIH